ncbi:MAG: PHP domain-containing protein [Desulfovibrio sp.]
MPGIDLHTHSTASDGTMTPTELVEHAYKREVSALALTDHDTTAGVTEAIDAGNKLGVEVISGCELSVTSDYGWMHIIGLFIQPEAPHLSQIFSFMKNSREIRNIQIVKKLQDLGIDITMKEVEERAGNTIGRPHMAQILVEKQVSRNTRAAFNEYLGDKGKAYVPKDNVSPRKAIETIHEDGGIAILAHPLLLSVGQAKMEEILTELRGLGLDGIETYYSLHSQRETEEMVRMADKLNLLESGGSDFHGTVKPLISLGTGKGSLYVPPRVLEEMKEYRKNRI